jgi:hypothetical protein
MFLTVRTPMGNIQSYDLQGWLGWELKLAKVSVFSDAEKPTPGLGLVLRGPMNGAPLTITLCAVNLGRPEAAVPELDMVARIGLGHGSLAKNRERLVEAMNVFANGDTFKAEEVAAFAEAAGKLAVAYSAFLKGCWGTRSTLDQVGALAEFEDLGWKWYLTATRFCSLPVNEAAEAGLGGDQGAGPGGGGGLGPLPGTEKKQPAKAPPKSSKRPPVLPPVDPPPGDDAAKSGEPSAEGGAAGGGAADEGASAAAPTAEGAEGGDKGKLF